MPNNLFYLMDESPSKKGTGQKRTIEVDLDIHKLIETERRDFSEAPNTILMRLLDLGEPEQRTNGRHRSQAIAGYRGDR